MTGNAYETEPAPEVEKKRLEDWTYPDEVSELFLKDVMKPHETSQFRESVANFFGIPPLPYPKSHFVDVGSGPSLSLGSWVQENYDSRYIAVDVNPTFVEAQQEGVWRKTYQASAEELPFEDNSIDYLHARFVLMHLPPERRATAIREMIRVGRTCVFIDYDWETMKTAPGSAAEKFKDFALWFLREVAHAEPNTGQHLKEYVEEAVGSQSISTEELVHQRETGEYHEIVSLIQSIISFLERQEEKYGEELAQAREIGQLLRGEMEKEDSVPFQPPAIKGLVVSKE